MSEVRKKFDKTLYDIADKAAKEAMIGWLKDRDHTDISSNEPTSGTLAWLRS